MSTATAHRVEVPSTGYLLKTDERLNPRDPAGNTYYQPGRGQVLYIVKADRGARPIKAFTSYGPIYGWHVDGPMAPVVADQSRRDLGYHRVIGMVAADGTMTGEVPDRNLPHYVFK